MSTEIWKPISGYEGLYEVSNLGRVRSFYKGGRIRKLQPDENGYLCVGLKRNGKRKTCRVHRLVALAFIPNPENKLEVNHDNGDKSDNRVENLIWATPSENSQHAYDTRLRGSGEDNPLSSLTNKQARQIRENPSGLNTMELGEKFSTDPATVSEIQRGITYKEAGGPIRDKIDRRIPDEVREQIRREYVKGSREFGTTALAKKYKVHPSTIWNIVNHRYGRYRSPEPQLSRN